MKAWPRPDVQIPVNSDGPSTWDTLDAIFEANPTGTKPVAFSFGDYQLVPVKSWTDLFNQLIDLLWDADPSNLFALANSDDSLVKYVDEVESYQKYRQLGTVDVAVYAGGNSAWSRVQHIKRILAGNGFDLGDISVKIRTVNRDYRDEHNICFVIPRYSWYDHLKRAILCG